MPFIPNKSIFTPSVLRMADVNTLEHRRIEQSLIIFFKCFKENGSCYIANIFKPRVTSYNFRSRGLNAEQNSYNRRFFHGSYKFFFFSYLEPAALSCKERA